MPIRLSSIPTHIRLEIIGKLNVEEFVNLQMSSKDGYILSKQVKTLITVPVDRIHFNGVGTVNVRTKESDRLDSVFNFSDVAHLRFDVKHTSIDHLNEALCQKLIQYFNSGGSTYKRIYFIFIKNWKLCSPTSFHELLKASNAEAFASHGVLSADYYSQLPTNITRMNVTAEDLEDKDLLKIKTEVTHLHLTKKITSDGLNAVFKEWAEGRRKIELLYVNTATDWEPHTKERMLNGFDYSEASGHNLFTINNGTELLHIDLRAPNRVGVAMDASRLARDPYDVAYFLNFDV